MKLIRIVIIILTLVWAASLHAISQEVWDDCNALGRLSVVNIRSHPAHKAELVTQALMGMPLRITESDGDWVKVETPDSYMGWAHSSSVVRKNTSELKEWRNSFARYVVTSPHQTYAYDNPTDRGTGHIVTDLVNGDIVELAEESHPRDSVLWKFILPDGRSCWINSLDLTKIGDWANQKYDSELILGMAYSMMGQPYLWGGTSIKGADCSGLTKICYLRSGIILRRDASQQATTGTKIKAADWSKCQPGDLLFFGNGSTKKVTHVGIYDKDSKYVHSSGYVRVNSLDPSSPLYLTTTLLHCCRIAGNEGKPGIVQVRDHPWYFNK